MGYSIREFHIRVPNHLIAQYPAEQRDLSRLLVYDLSKDRVHDDCFKNITSYITPNDCVIYNDAKVLHARLYGRKEKAGARLEILLTRRVSKTEWHCLIRPARRVRVGTSLSIGENFSLTVVEKGDEGLFRVEFQKPLELDDLQRIGKIPLPKYIRRRPDPSVDNERYQTIFSHCYGAVAAPTAGLHFTQPLVDELKQKGAVFASITLYVDWGTFKPIREIDYRDHKIHSEVYEVPEETARIVNRCIDEGRRIICVGTTTVRTVESVVDKNGKLTAGRGETGLYIYPGYSFKLVDGMITNFHMPDSTLILLVAAFAGKERIERAYHHAIHKGYRFFSYGDAMFLYKERFYGVYNGRVNKS